MSEQSAIFPNRPLVSVIVPVYNGERYIRTALQSIFEQDYYPLEVIVVDDGSTDSTAQIIGKYGNVQYIYQTNQGVASARNAGIDASRGEIIAFLDSDDFWPPSRLIVTVRYFQQHPEVGYVLGKQMMFIEPGCSVPPGVKAEWLVEPQDASNTAVLVVRRESFGLVGLFNTHYRGGEDTEWFVRASETGVPMARLPEVVLHRRIHEGNLSIQMMQMRRANLFKIASESIQRRRKRSCSNAQETNEQEGEIGLINRPLVSVIVPVFNGGQYIRAALQSAFGQDYRPIEVIVVDDGSTDNTAELVRSFKDVVYILQSNQGVAAARNVGISIAQGEFIAFLDADDLWTTDKLTRQINWLLEHPDTGYVTAKFRNFLEKGIKRPAWLKEEQLLEDQTGGVPNLVVRKSVFQKIGAFDANCRSGSDLDWVLRAKDAEISTIALPHTLLHRRIHDSNLSHQWRGGRSLLLKSLKASIDRQRAHKAKKTDE